MFEGKPNSIHLLPDPNLPIHPKLAHQTVVNIKPPRILHKNPSQLLFFQPNILLRECEIDPSSLFHPTGEAFVSTGINIKVDRYLSNFKSHKEKDSSYPNFYGNWPFYWKFLKWLLYISIFFLFPIAKIEIFAK